MSAEDKVREAEAILAAIESGTPLRTCIQLADEFGKTIKLLEEAGCTERSEWLRWDSALCVLPSFTTIVRPSNSKQRFPSVFEFPDDAIAYYTERAAQVTNSVLKARYSDFLWEKSSSSDKHKFAEAAIDAYLENACRFAESVEMVSHWWAMVDALDRAAVLSIQLNNCDKVAATVTTLIERLREVNTTRDNSQFYVGRGTIEPARMLLYIKQRRRFADLVDDTTLIRVQQIAEELATAHAAAGEYGGEQAFLELAAQVALLRSDNEVAYRMRLRYGESLEQQAEARAAAGTNTSHLAAAALYGEALKHYANLESDERTPDERRSELQQHISHLKHKIREMFHLGRPEMKYVTFPVEVPREELEQRMTELLEPDTLDACLERLVSEGSLLPNVAIAEDWAKQTKDIAPMFASLPISIVSDDMSVAKAISEEEKFQFAVDSHLEMQIKINSHLLLSEFFTRLCSQRGLDVDSMLKFFDDWGLIDEDNREIIRVGLERYFADDYVSALHILALQFEDVLRTLFEKAGKPVIRLRRGEHGWQFEPFGTFLDRDFVKQAMPLELREYIRLVMADPKGWDLRNRVAHGLIHPQQCTKPVVDTVLHLFLLLTRFYIREESQTQSREEG